MPCVRSDYGTGDHGASILSADCSSSFIIAELRLADKQQFSENAGKMRPPRHGRSGRVLHISWQQSHRASR